jgi:hypothetical protein
MAAPQAVDFTVLRDVLPPLIWRSRWNELADRYGLPYRRSYIEDLNAKDLGPKMAVLHGRVCFTRDDLIQWLSDRQG